MDNSRTVLAAQRALLAQSILKPELGDAKSQTARRGAQRRSGRAQVAARGVERRLHRRALELARSQDAVFLDPSAQRGLGNVQRACDTMLHPIVLLEGVLELFARLPATRRCRACIAWPGSAFGIG